MIRAVLRSTGSVPAVTIWCAVLALMLCLGCSTRGPAVKLTATSVDTRDATHGATVIEWDTGDGTDGRVYVVVDDGSPSLFASGSKGTAVATWITAHSRYEFRLHGGSGQQLLATVIVAPLRKGLSPILAMAMAVLFGGVWYARRSGARRANLMLVAWALLVLGTTVATVLIVESKPLKDQPSPDAWEYADAARQLAAGNGYVTYVHDDQRHPPRYPPGFSLMLTPFAWFGQYPANVQLGAKLYAALYVVAAFGVAWALGGPLAAAVAVLFIGLSPFAYVSASLILSDAVAAAGTVLIVGLARQSSARRASAIGALAGALVATRLSLVVNVLAALLRAPRQYRRRTMMFTAPFLVALAWYHWTTFGSPLRTGYSYWLPNVSAFEWAYGFLPNAGNNDGPWIVPDALNGLLMKWTCPCQAGGPIASVSNIVLYPATLLGLFWVYAPPFVTVAGLIYLWKHRRESAAAVGIWIIALSLGLFSFYFATGVRFMAGPATVLLVFSAVSAADWANRTVLAGGPPPASR